MNLFEKMCKVCNRCEETSIEKCFLVKESYNKELKETLLLKKDLSKYPLCNRCIHYQSNSSSIFGEAWVCLKKMKNDVFDNDWHEEMNEPIVDCKEYVFGIPGNNYYG